VGTMPVLLSHAGREEGGVKKIEPAAVDADALPPDEIEALKQRERSGRDEGASSFFEKIAARGPFILKAEDDTLARYIAPRPEFDVLDAGSGVGRQALAIAPRVRRLTCVDFSARALELLAAEARRRGITNLETRPADLCDLPADLGRFDISVFGSILLHLRDPFLALSQAAERTDEAVVVVEPLAHDGADLDQPVLRWNPTRGVSPNGWWNLSPGAVTEMLAVLGFPNSTVTYHREPYRPESDPGSCPVDVTNYTVVARRI